MPEVASVAQANRLAVLDYVGDDQYFGMAGQQELLQYMDLQRSKASAELYLLLWSDVLLAKHEHVMIEVRTMDAGEAGVVQFA